MIFNSLIFIFLFFPVSIALYYLIPVRYVKNVILLILSLLFYSWSNPVTLILLLISIAWNFFTGIEMGNEEDGKRRKIILIVAIVFNLFILCVYKYLDFIVPFDIQVPAVPMGLSFFTFSSISYLMDVYSHKAEAQKDPVLFSLYISFFGKISMGPIVPYHKMQDELAKREFNREDITSGTMLFIKGLIKKVLLADQFAMVFSDLSTQTSVVGAWLYAIAYMLQLYFDFSGYSDMAIGIGRIFGFHFDINFNHPYIAKSVQDFWRRWHMSLSQWFRDYLYIPLGGSRVDTRKYVRNILIVWFATGLWHGANWTFIVWGLYYALFLLLEKFFLREWLNKLPGIVSHIYTLLVVLIGWVFFFSPSIVDAFVNLGHMFGINSSGVINDSTLFIAKEYLILFIFGIFFSTNLYDRIQTVLYNVLKNKAIYLTTVIYILCFILCIAFIIGSTYKSFLYFAF